MKTSYLLLIVLFFVTISKSQVPDWESVTTLGTPGATSVATDGYGQHLVGVYSSAVKHYLVGNNNVVIYNNLSVTSGEYPSVSTYNGKVRVTLKLGDYIKVYESTDGGATWPNVYQQNFSVTIKNIQTYWDGYGTHIVWENNNDPYDSDESYYVRCENSNGNFVGFKNVTDLSSPSTGRAPRVITVGSKAAVGFLDGRIHSRDLDITTDTWDNAYKSTTAHGNLTMSLGVVGTDIYSVMVEDILLGGGCTQHLRYAQRNINGSWGDVNEIVCTNFLQPDPHKTQNAISYNGLFHAMNYTTSRMSYLYYNPSTQLWSTPVDIEVASDIERENAMMSAGVHGLYAFWNGSSSSLHQHFRRKPYGISGAIVSNTFFTGNDWLIDNATMGSGVTATFKSGCSTTFSAGKTLTVNSGGILVYEAGTSGISFGVGSGIVVSGGTFQIASGATFVVNSSNNLQFGSNSTLRISGTLKLPANYTLTIPSTSQLKMDPGSRCELGSGAQIVCNGKIVANGSSSNRITITSSNASPSAGAWNGIVCSGGGPDTLKYTDILYATTGLSISNTSGVSLVDNSTVTYCSADGIAVTYTSSVILKALIQYSTIMNNNKGLNVTSALVHLKQTRIANNTTDGVYLGSSKLYMWDSRIDNNSGYGMYISGSTAYAWLKQSGDITYSGRNTLNQNTLGELYVTNSGGAFLGERVTYVYCDCGVSNNKNGIGGSIFSEGCDPECEAIDITEDHGGYNNVYNSYSFNGRLVYNSSSLIKAHMNYWGSCPPPSSAFIGSIDYSYCLSNPVYTPAKFLSSVLADDENEGMTKGNGNGITSLTDEEKLRAWVHHLRKTISENPDNAIDAFRSLEDLVGVGGKHQRELEIPWELFIELLELSSSSSTLKPVVKAYRLQAKMDAEKFEDAIGLANQILSKKTNDALWLHCNVQKVIAYTALGDYANAQATYQAMENRARTLDGTMVDNLHKLLFATPTGKNQTVSNSHALSKQIGSQTQSEKPKEFALEQNYPNPFNPVTVIRYQLPEDVFVTLKIYDVLGKEVAVLVNGYEVGGYKSVEFDASKLSSGIFFYKLVAGNYIATKKLAVMK
ncbi:MAG: T9SS type A sorting domain-containing protein [Ignavibacteriales bacterium]|nr:T9SS type A sorting domain-containing protein [Ignavibacteriales bacterium]